MLANVYDGMEMYGSGYSNWAILALNIQEKYFEIVVTGEETNSLAKALQENYVPNALFAGGKGNLPILDGKSSSEPMIFTCIEGSCLIPTDEIDVVLELTK